MKFTIDTEKLKEFDINISELCYLLSLYFDSPVGKNAVNSIKDKGYSLKFPDDYIPPYKISAKGKDLINRIFLACEFRGDESTPDRFELLADKLRELYPKGMKPGTNYMWRDSRAIIAKKLKAVVKKYGDCFTDEEAIEATQRYIASFNSNYAYMQLLKYFIHKQRTVNGIVEETSQMLSFIENKDAVSIDEDWTSELR